MPDEEKILIARFLRANDYSQTLSSFLAEAGLSEDAGSNSTRNDLTLEKLLQEKRAYDLAANFEKLGTDEAVQWHVPAPASPSEIHLANPSNVLSLAVQSTLSRDGSLGPRMLSSGADRRLNIVGCNALEASEKLSTQEAPVLCIMPLQDHLIIGDMAGNVKLLSKDGDVVLDRRKDHTKYVVKIAVLQRTDGTWVASAGWDAKVYLYWMPVSESSSALGDPMASIDLPTNPEAMLFVPHPDSGHLCLILSRRDSTFLYYYEVPDTTGPSSMKQRVDLAMLGRQNLAPHALSWVTYTPSDMALCPTDGTKIAVATSSIPHMKLIIVRLLFPVGPETGVANERPEHFGSTTASEPEPSDRNRIQGPESDAAAAAREQLAVQNREEAAIIVSCNTMAPQTQYSTPVVVWRPDGSGCFVNGDDGIIRGVETSSGKVVCRLQGHESGSKVRCLWAGNVELADESSETVAKEWLISGGFDQRLIVWR